MNDMKPYFISGYEVEKSLVSEMRDITSDQMINLIFFEFSYERNVERPFIREVRDGNVEFINE